MKFYNAKAHLNMTTYQQLPLCRCGYAMLHKDCCLLFFCLQNWLFQELCLQCMLIIHLELYLHSLSGLIHTRHFGTQYCDITIKRYCDKKIISSHMFQWPTKVSSEKTYLDFFKEFTSAYRDPWPKKCLFIAISFYRNIVCENVSCE